MAAAAIPLIASLAPSIIDLIVGLVHKGAPKQEAALGDKTGPVKFANLFVSVMSDLAKAHAAGSISDIPSDDAAKTIIQSVISSMKLLGLLNGASIPDAPGPASVIPTGSPVVPAATAPAKQSFVLANGQILTFSVA